MDEKDTPKRQPTADELAAAQAEAMFKSGRGGQGGQPITQQHAEQRADPIEKAGGAGGMPTTTAAATGGFTDKAGGKVLDKSDDDDADDKDKEEEGGEDEAEKGCAKKSEDAEPEIDADTLMKSLDALDAAADGLEEPQVDRRAELAKSAAEGTITDEERLELVELLGGQAPAPASDAINKSDPDPDPDLDEPLDKGFEEVFSEEFGDDYDVSPFLEKFGHTVGASLDIMREDLAKSAGDQVRFNKALSKSFRGVAQVIQRQEDMIKSLAGQNSALAERLGIVEQQPVGRKSVSTPREAVLNKSFAGQEPTDGGLNREQIFKGLFGLMAKYKNTGGRARNGEPIDRAITQFELSGNISKSLLDEVKDNLGGSQ
jgi:hypothetical protein